MRLSRSTSGKSAGGIGNAAMSLGCTHAISDAKCGVGVPCHVTHLYNNKSKCRSPNGSLAKVSGIRSRGLTEIPSSSNSSRASAASGVSPGSTLPPGNSHNPPIEAWSGRFCSRIAPLPFANAAATTNNVVGFFSIISSGCKLLLTLVWDFPGARNQGSKGTRK